MEYNLWRSLGPKTKYQATLTLSFVFYRSTCRQRAVCSSSSFKFCIFSRVRIGLFLPRPRGNLPRHSFLSIYRAFALGLFFPATETLLALKNQQNVTHLRRWANHLWPKLSQRWSNYVILPRQCCNGIGSHPAGLCINRKWPWRPDATGTFNSESLKSF